MEVFKYLRAAKDELTKAVNPPEAMSIFEDVWGEMHVEHDTVNKRLDITPLLKGLPNGFCQVPHWGVITKGQVAVKYEGGKEEVLKAGDAFYLPPGHTAIFEAGTELWEFSPNDKIQKRGLYA